MCVIVYKKFWKTVKPLLSRKVSIANSITLINGDQIVSDENKVAETLNKFLSVLKYFAVEIFFPKLRKYSKNRKYFPCAILDFYCVLENNFCNSNQDSIDNIVTKFKSYPSIIEIKRNISCSSKFVFSEINMKDIDQELKHLNTKKANTHKNIPVKILKDFSEVCLPTLLNIINNCLRTCKFPDELKLADVTPIFKKGEKTLAKNYRPISVLPVVSKVLERIMQKQISSHIEKYLSPYLCGYRRGYNTQHALTAMIEKWKRTLDNRGYAGAVLMDLSKAFDTLNHDLLIAKLEAYGFAKEALNMIKSYLKNRWQRTKINKCFSSWSELLKGVPQGSILGPLLFNIYLNDLFYICEKLDVCNFADDTTFYNCDLDLSAVLQRLEHDCTLATEWFEDNYMKLNEDKCHLLISGNKYQHHFLSIKQCKIRESQSEKLLGIDIDRNLDFINYVNTVCIKANSKLSALARISKYLSLEKRKVLFKSFFESQFTYCPLVWMFHDRKMNNKINKLHERALRLVYSDDKSSFQELLDIDNSVTIHNRNLRVLALEIFKFIHGLLPSIMENISCLSLLIDEHFAHNKIFTFQMLKVFIRVRTH